MPWKLIGQPSWPRKTAITLSATHLSLAHGTNHQLKKQKFEKLSQQSERPATWATLIMQGPGLRLLHGIRGIILCVQRSWQRILFVRGSKSQISGIRFMNLGSTSILGTTTFVEVMEPKIQPMSFA